MCGVICLLNRESVANEILELARYRVIQILRVPSEAVTACWEAQELTQGGYRLLPTFNVNMEYAKGLEEQQVTDVLAKAYGELREELQHRMSGLSDCWQNHHGEIEEQKEDEA